MKFLAMTLVANHEGLPATRRYADLVETARCVEQLGFDAFGIGERHDHPFLSSSPAVLLGHLAAHTTTVRLCPTVATLSLHDPVRAVEDYATVDNLSGGRLDLMVGKGSGAAHHDLFGIAGDELRERGAEAYRLFRRLWNDEQVRWSGRFRPPLTDAGTQPRPAQRRLGIWHGSATSRESVDLAARHGDPLFSANGSGRTATYAALVDHYRERLRFWGHDPATTPVGIGTWGFHTALRSQDAIGSYRPVYEARLRLFAQAGIRPHFATIEDAIEHGSLLVGSPAQIVDQVHRMHERFRHDVLAVQAEADGVDHAAHVRALELFQSDIAPTLRKGCPDSVAGW